MSDTVQVERRGAAQIITINRPDVRNAVDPDTAAALKAAFLDGEADDYVAVHILTGAAGHFCAGADLKAVSEGKRYERTGPMGPSWLSLTKPSIAAVEGHAVAGGLELAIMCDLRVAANSAVFGVYCRRWGVPLIDGGTVRLPRLAGEGRAMEIILTGRKVTAEECARIGLCEYLVEDGGSRDKAEELAREIARFPQHCLRSDRRSARRQHALSLREALKQEWENSRSSLAAGGLEGAGRFRDGAGRHGDFGKI